MTEPSSSGILPADQIRDGVRERYAKLATGGGCCSTPDSSGGCCGGELDACCTAGSTSEQLGYAPEDLALLPAGANLGLGCGNPTALASLTPGEVVVDLGSGAGVDCFLAVRRVGPTGRVIGVDMTPSMVQKARELARTAGLPNVEFRLGEVEHLPVADHSVDVILSNCVLNLVPEKGPVYLEAFRILRPGGRLALSDVVATRPISDEARRDPTLWAGCSSGALPVPEISRLLREAGFEEISIELTGGESPPDSLAPQAGLGVVSASIRARKPLA